MAWSAFSAFDQLSQELELPLLVGVVPDCRDQKLAVEPARSDFWDGVRAWRERGWTIAQHGYTHQYVSNDSGILGINRRSEFAGIGFEEQLEKLRLGKEIMSTEGVWQPVFMAPAHSFDQNTIKALDELEFRYITDGYGLYPYTISKLTAVPQLFGSPFHLGFGVYTICLHVNSMSHVQIGEIIRFVRTHRDQFISFEEAASIKPGVPGLSAGIRLASSIAMRSIRGVKRMAKVS